MTVQEVIAAYARLYPGRMQPAEVEMYAPSALAYVEVVTARRSDSATGWKLDRAMQAVCAGINEMAAQDAAKSETGARLAGVSNDGYSESYGTGGADAEGEAIRNVMRHWLSGTGLVSAL